MKTLIIRRGARLTIRAIATGMGDRGRDKCPTLAFFEEQAQYRADEVLKLAALLTETAASGPPKNESKFRDLPGTEDLFEFKTSGGLRVFCFWDDGSLIICTHGYLKSGQKAPKRETNRAERMRRDYFLAKQNGTLDHAQPRESGVR
jgi:phage-related protein